MQTTTSSAHALLHLPRRHPAPRVLVIPSKHVTGWEGGDVVRDFPAVPIEEALATQYDTDAHFSCYYVDSVEGVEERIPRINKRGLPDLASLGGKLRFGVLAVDVDAPKGEERPDDFVKEFWRSAQKQILDSVDWIDTAARYDTSDGYRLVWLLPEPLDVEEFQRWGVALRQELRDLGVPADEACKDWGRIYRLPYVPRYKTGCTRDLERIDIIEWRPPPKPEPTVGRLLARPHDLRTRFKLPDRIPEGGKQGRNVTLTRLAGSMRAVGLEPEAILAALVEVNEDKCDPPLPQSELENIARSSGRWEAPDLDEIEKAEDALPKGPRIWNSPDQAKIAVDIAKDVGPRFEHGSEVEFACAVLERFEHGARELVNDEGTTWGYLESEGVWVEIAEDVGFAGVRALDKELVPSGKVGKDGTANLQRLKVTQRLCKDVWAMARSMRARRGFFADARKGVAFLNGFWCPVRKRLMAHDPDHRARHLLAFVFDADAPAPRWERALREWLEPLGEQAGPVAELLAEFVGAALCGLSTHYQRALILYGPLASNGKSQFLEVISALFPSDAVTSVPPQQMDQEYRRAQLSSARLNVVSELPEADILRSEGLKGLITGDRMQGRQPYREVFEFNPEAGHIFGANTLPAVRDTTHGFWRRWVVVPFLRVFDEAAKGHVPRIAADIIEHDLPGVAAWALRGAERVSRRGRYDIPEACQKALDEWRFEADQVAAFISEETTDEEDRARWISGRDLFRAYESWALRNRRKPLNLTNFGRRVKTFRGIEKIRTRQGILYSISLKKRSEMGQ